MLLLWFGPHKVFVHGPSMIPLMYELERYFHRLAVRECWTNGQFEK